MTLSIAFSPMDLLFEKMCLSTRFTTNKVVKDFLPRRIGLGYRIAHLRLNRDIVKPCVRAKMKKSEDTKTESISDEEMGRSAMVKKLCRSSSTR